MKIFFDLECKKGTFICTYLLQKKKKFQTAPIFFVSHTPLVAVHAPHFWQEKKIKDMYSSETPVSS